MLDDRDLAALALTSRLVPCAVKPLTAREFWPLLQRIALSDLHGRAAEDMAAELSCSLPEAERLASLLERGAALALAIEELEHAGTWTITGSGADYPRRLAERLGHAAPPVLHGVGDRSFLARDGVGVVGSRDVDEAGVGVAREVAQLAVAQGLPVISGAARGVDQQAMNAAFEVEGDVVGVLADALNDAVRRPSTRRAISGGTVCLVTPYAPTAGFSAGNAMGRNKIIYGLCRAVVVVRSDEGTGGTWSGAVEALRKEWTAVLSWTGPGSAQGNRALLTKGALEFTSMAGLKAHLAAEPGVSAAAVTDPGAQLSLPI